MGKLLYVRLDSGEILEKDNSSADYGRGLIARLFKENVAPGTDRLDDANAIILAPGLLSGTMAPSTGRLLIATREASQGGIQIVNLAGTISQKLASLNIEAVVITGKAPGANAVTLFLEKGGAALLLAPELAGLMVTPAIQRIRETHGQDCAIIGIGPAGEQLLPLSSIFSTYPQGRPAFYCARDGFGDVLGAKGLKAIIVSGSEHFSSPVLDQATFGSASKNLSRIIIHHPICGGTLPALGSITLLNLMKQGKAIAYEAPKTAAPIATNKDKAPTGNPSPKAQVINRTCSPFCVVGCLNRHASSTEDFYSAPVESEASAALRDSFAIEDRQFVRDFTARCFELGLDCMEFIFSCAMYFKLSGVTVQPSTLCQALDDIQAMTLTGRILGSTTKGIYTLFREKQGAQAMVSHPSVAEENRFPLGIPSKPELPGLSQLDYLYAYIILLENLGFCLFTAFAFLDSPQALPLLAQLVQAKTGNPLDPHELLGYAQATLAAEKAYAQAGEEGNARKSIPNFVKVLYRCYPAAETAPGVTSPS